MPCRGGLRHEPSHASGRKRPSAGGRRETQNAYKSKYFREKIGGKQTKPHSTFHRANSIKLFLKKSTFPLLEGLT